MKTIFQLIIIIIFGCLTFVLLYKVLGFFNFLPFAIHQQFLREIVRENVFILIFDLFLSTLAAILLFIFLRKRIKNR